jgi:hypothetical protein
MRYGRLSVAPEYAEGQAACFDVPQKPRRTRLLALVVTAAFALSSCGDDKSDEAQAAAKHAAKVQADFMYENGGQNFSTPIEIDGDESCVADTVEALKLLEERAPTHLQEVEENVGRIACQPSQSGMNVWAETPTFEVGDQTRQAGVVWYAGSIVHDAKHADLYHDYQDASPAVPVPDLVWTGRDAEQACLDVQADALQQIGAPDDTVQYIREEAIDTGYYDVPIEQRTW